MAWQPLPPASAGADDERLIATGGDDCAILIWNARRPDTKAKCFLTMDQPIVRLAFTPDGAFIAGATSRQVLIWKVDNHAMPRASWNRPPHPGWLTPKGSSESDEEDEHCLCWDVSGQKLAYGSNSRVSLGRLDAFAGLILTPRQARRYQLQPVAGDDPVGGLKAAQAERTIMTELILLKLNVDTNCSTQRYCGIGPWQLGMKITSSTRPVSM